MRFVYSIVAVALFCSTGVNAALRDTLQVTNLSSSLHVISASGEIPAMVFRRHDAGPPLDITVPLPTILTDPLQVGTDSIVALARYFRWRTVAQAPSHLQASPVTRVRSAGYKAWVPQHVIQIWPWRISNGQIEIADSVEVALQRTVHSSVYDSPQVVASDYSWYDPQQPYVRIETSADGVGSISAGQVMTTEPRFQGAPIRDLVLYWKGKKQPLYVDGKVGTDFFSDTDTIYFIAHRPQGDTSFLSMEDTTAVMFLSVCPNCDNPRLTYASPSGTPVSIPSVRLEQHFELDTGYYHLGNADNLDYSDFNSNLVYLEGYYWFFLNARDYTRAEWKFPLAPDPNGTVRITTKFASTTGLAQYAPDGRLDVCFNGSVLQNREYNGYGLQTLVSELPGSECPSGYQLVKYYATGIDSLRKYKDYLSQLAIDAIEVSADIVPVLEKGSRIVQVPARSRVSSISWYNAQTSKGWWIDTTSRTIGKATPSGRGIVIRGGLTPVEPDWTTSAPSTDTWRASALIGLAEVSPDTITGLTLAWTDNTGNSTIIKNATEGAVADKIRQLPTSTAFVLWGPNTPPGNVLANALNSRSLTVPVSTHWILCGILDTGGRVQEGDSRRAYGSLFRHQWDTAPGFVFETILPEGDQTVVYVADAAAVEPARVLPSALANLRADTSQADVIIIAYRTHLEQARRLAQHREKFNGLTVKIVDIDNILAEFGFGMRNAEAVRSYLAWHFSHAKAPSIQAAILFGNASWDPRLAVKGGNVQARMPDQVPTYGRPSSDYYYSLLDSPDDLISPEILVGRLPAITAADGKAIVDKIIECDTVPADRWNRTWYFVGGGTENEGLCNIYQTMLSDPLGTGVKITERPFCADTVTLCKSTAPKNAGYFITQTINAGVQWMNYVGHGATELFDINGWEPSELDNTGKYGVLATFACQTGAFSNPSVPCKNAQYITHPGKGFVASMGATGWQEVFLADYLHFRLHQIMMEGARSLGQIMYEAKKSIGFTDNQASYNVLMQYCLLGDPYSRIKIDNKPNIRLRPSDLGISSELGERQITDRDSVAIASLTVLNQGVGTTIPLRIRMIRTYKSVTDTLFVDVHDGICASPTVLFKIPVTNMAGDHQLVITADPDGYYGDDSADNSITSKFTVLPQSLLPLEPVPYERLSGTEVHVRQISPHYFTTNQHAEFVICTNTRNPDSSTVVVSTPEQVSVMGTIVNWWSPLPDSLKNTQLWIGSRIITPGVDTSARLWVPFMVADDSARAYVPATSLVAYHESRVQFNRINGTLQLRHTTLPIFLRSNGLRTSLDENNPPVQITVGSITYVKNPFFRGINLVVLSTSDTVPRAIRRYDTWKDPIPAESNHNGYSRELIAFLQDSVKQGEYVLFASSDESFSGFVKDNNLDTLSTILKEYGSRYSDSLAPNSSWVMIGRRGLTPGQAPEAWKGAPDTLVTLNDSMSFYADEATVSTPWIGPARSWDHAVLSYDTYGTDAVLKAQLHNGTEYSLPVVTADSILYDLSDLPSDVSFVKVEWNLRHRSDSMPNTWVRNALVHYQPAHEVLIDTLGVVLADTTVLQGDSAVVHVTVQNADRRWGTDTMLVEILTGTQPETPVAQQSVTLAANRNATIPFVLSTVNLSGTTTVTARINSNQQRQEFYSFNNTGTAQLNVSTDTTPPNILTYADGNRVTSGDYVAPEPLIEVQLTDNSRIPITDASRLVVFVNGLRIRKESVTDYRFYPTDSCRIYYTDKTVKAALKFKTPLENGQNNLLIRATDATGNPIEKEVSLYLSTIPAVASVAVHPSPSHGRTDFVIRFQSPLPETPGTLTIHDMQGRQVRQLETTLTNGVNTVYWDGLTDSGNSVSSGIYGWIIRAAIAPSASPAIRTGTLIIVH